MTTPSPSMRKANGAPGTPRPPVAGSTDGLTVEVVNTVVVAVEGVAEVATGVVVVEGVVVVLVVVVVVDAARRTMGPSSPFWVNR